MLALPPTLTGNVDAVVMQRMQCPTRWMKYVVMEDAGHMKVDAVRLQSLQCPLQYLECGCSAHAVVAVSHKVDVVCCYGRCSVHGGGCRKPVLNAVCLQCDFSCRLCPCSGCSAHCIV